MLAQAEAFRARPVERGDRWQTVGAADVAEEEVELVDDAAYLGRELDLDGDVVRDAVHVVVDVERIAHVRVEQEVVGSGARLLAGDHVHDEHHLVRVARLVAAEHEEIRDIRGRVERDERGFAVARGVGRLRRARGDRERGGERDDAERAEGAWKSHGVLLGTSASSR